MRKLYSLAIWKVCHVRLQQILEDLIFRFVDVLISYFLTWCSRITFIVIIINFWQTDGFIYRHLEYIFEFLLHLVYLLFPVQSEWNPWRITSDWYSIQHLGNIRLWVQSIVWRPSTGQNLSQVVWNQSVLVCLDAQKFTSTISHLCI